MAPIFRLTPGATISPASGSVHDFSDERPVKYTVTSEDGAWSRIYNVSFVRQRLSLKYDFENPRLEENEGAGPFYVWKEIDSDGNELPDFWASGNGGFWVAQSNAPVDAYPTVPLAEGFDGKGVKLTTCDTGPWGAAVNKRIAAGNLFIGKFIWSMAMIKPMEATEFGRWFTKEPRTLKGYYKYRPGDVFQDINGRPVEGRRDSAAIYSVLYRSHDTDGKEVVLHGNDVMTNANIVAIARMWDVKYTDEWTPFEIEYVYKQPLDYTLLGENGYKMTVVFSSSKDGDLFEGAIGSTLCIDKVSVECLDEAVDGADDEAGDESGDDAGDIGDGDTADTGNAE